MPVPKIARWNMVGFLQAPNVRVNATFNLAAFTIDSFNDTAKDQFRGAIADAARRSYQTTVTTTINSVQPGSVAVDTSLLFLAPSSAVVNNFKADLQVDLRSTTQTIEYLTAVSNSQTQSQHARCIQSDIPFGVSLQIIFLSNFALLGPATLMDALFALSIQSVYLRA